MIRTSLACLTLLAALAAPAGAEEVEHPTYLSWARHPVGTTVALRSVTSSPGSAITTTTTYRLLELKPDKAVLETRKVSDATGKVVEGLPDRYEQRRMFPLLPGIKKEQIGKPTDATAQGEETLKILGREIKAVWYDTKSKGDSGDVLTRTWLSEDVPGRIARVETQIPRASTTITIDVVEFKTPEARP